MTKLYVSTLVALVGILSFSSACSHKKVFETTDNQVTKNDVITIAAEWLKDKGKAYDIQFNIKNVSAADIIFRLDDLGCFRGSEEGTFKYTFFNTGRKTLRFAPGQLRQFRMRCTLGGKSEGQPRIVVNRVFDNSGPSTVNDDEATGKVIAQQITWVYSGK